MSGIIIPLEISRRIVHRKECPHTQIRTAEAPVRLLWTTISARFLRDEQGEECNSRAGFGHVGERSIATRTFDTPAAVVEYLSAIDCDLRAFDVYDDGVYFELSVSDTKWGSTG